MTRSQQLRNLRRRLRRINQAIAALQTLERDIARTGPTKGILALPPRSCILLARTQISPSPSARKVLAFPGSARSAAPAEKGVVSLENQASQQRL